MKKKPNLLASPNLWEITNHGDGRYNSRIEFLRASLQAMQAHIGVLYVPPVGP